MKNNKFAFNALLKKDLKIFFLNRQVLFAIIIIVAVFSIVYPLIFSSTIIYSSGEDLQEVIDMIGGSADTSKAELLSGLLNYLSAFILLTPLMLGNLLGNSVVTIEKENKTLETILYCPMETKDLIKNKMLVTFIPGLIITIASFICALFSINIMSLFNNLGVILPSINTIICCFIFGPVVMFLCLTFTVKFSLRAENSTQAQQKSVFFLLPMIFIVIILVFVLNSLGGIFSIILYFIVSSIIFLLAMLLFKKIVKTFTPEELLK